ncbi:hypothetical protein M5689_005489 [Euphorbia peplus]|nr:hypothetical protein M5689_005489 [Euphorbia peplus]
MLVCSPKPLQMLSENSSRGNIVENLNREVQLYMIDLKVLRLVDYLRLHPIRNLGSYSLGGSESSLREAAFSSLKTKKLK